MDLTSLNALINFALITIIYSTFIAPSLVKLGELKEQISNLRTSSKKDFSENEGLKLKGLISRYQSRFVKLKGTLRYFAIIVAVLLLANAIVTLMKYGLVWNNGTQQATVYFVATIIVLVFISIVIFSYLTPPWKIKSLVWLASNAGYSPVHYKDLFDAKVELGENLGNSKNDNQNFDVAITSNFPFTDYSFVLTVENNKGELFYVSMGRQRRRLSTRTLIQTSTGYERKAVRLGKNISLKNGSYKIKLLLFIAPFSGHYCAVEKQASFVVEQGRLVKIIKEPIDLSQKISYQSHSSAYTFERSKEKICKINFEEGSDVSQPLSNIFSLKSIQSALNSKGGIITAEDIDGKLDLSLLRLLFSKKSIALTRAKQRLKFKRELFLKLN